MPPKPDTNRINWAIRDFLVKGEWNKSAENDYMAEVTFEIRWGPPTL